MDRQSSSGGWLEEVVDDDVGGLIGRRPDDDEDGVELGDAGADRLQRRQQVGAARRLQRQDPKTTLVDNCPVHLRVAMDIQEYSNTLL